LFWFCRARVCVQHFADYQCNSSMEIFKLLKDPRHAATGGGFKKPADVGQAVCDAMQGMGLVGPIIAKLSVAPQVMRTHALCIADRFLFLCVASGSDSH